MTHLEDILKTHLSAENHPINKIPKTCCFDSTLEVIDFDKVKERFCQDYSIGHTLCSVDCLYINPSKGVICLIEMKNISMHLWRLNKKYVKYENFSKALTNSFEALHGELRDKFVDSMFLITAAAGLYGVSTNELASLLDRSKAQIKYAVVAYMKSSDYLAYQLASLDVKKVKHGLLNEPDGHSSHLITNAKEFENFVANHL